MLLPADGYELQHPVSTQARSTFLYASHPSRPHRYENSRLAAGFTEYFGDDDWLVDWADAIEDEGGGFAVTVHASYDPNDKKRRVAAAYWSEKLDSWPKPGQSR